MDFQNELNERFKLQQEYLGNHKAVNYIKPIVSVCVATYQHVNFIKECLEGILMQQTSFPYEIILGEDESTDGTREICIEYAEKYPDKIRLFLRNRELTHFHINGNDMIMNSRLNRMSACGKYIALCEGDDFWTDPLKLQKQVDFMEKNLEYSFCFHDANFTDEKGVIQTQQNSANIYKEEYSQNEIMSGSIHFRLHTLLFRNTIATMPEESLNVIGGDKFLISILGEYGKGRFLKDIAKSAYRVHKGGIWSSKSPAEQKITIITTAYWIARYYQRIGKSEIAHSFYEKIRNQINDIDPIINNHRHFFLKEKSKTFLIRLNKIIRKYSK